MEWIDNGRNLITEQLLIDMILKIEEDKPAKLDTIQFWAFNTLTEKAKMIQDAKYLKKTTERSFGQPTLSGKKPPKLLSAPEKPDKQTSSTFDGKFYVTNWYNSNGENQWKSARHVEILYLHLNSSQPLITSWIKQELMICKIVETLGGIFKR